MAVTTYFNEVQIINMPNIILMYSEIQEFILALKKHVIIFSNNNEYFI